MEPAERFAQALQENGLTQADFIRKVGSDPSYVSKIKNGIRPLTDKFARRVAPVLGVRHEWLLTGEEPMRPPSVLAHDLGHDLLNLVERRMAAAQDPEDAARIDDEDAAENISTHVLYAEMSKRLDRLSGRAGSAAEGPAEYGVGDDTAVV